MSLGSECTNQPAFIDFGDVDGKRIADSRQAENMRTNEVCANSCSSPFHLQFSSLAEMDRGAGKLLFLGK